MITESALSTCMPKRDNEGRSATFRCVNQTGMPSLFRRLAWEYRDMRTAQTVAVLKRNASVSVLDCGTLSA